MSLFAVKYPIYEHLETELIVALSKRGSVAADA